VERCEECGFDPATVDPVSAPDAIRAFGRRWQAPLRRFLPGEDGDALVRARPAAGVWSALEYGTHVRDVFALFDRRVVHIAKEDDPALEVIDHDAAVRDGNYNRLDPATVAGEVAGAADGLAATLESVGPEAWSRAGTRDGERRTVLDLAQRAVHEGNHHLLDAGRVLRAARGR